MQESALLKAVETMQTGQRQALLASADDDATAKSQRAPLQFQGTELACSAINVIVARCSRCEY
jgi:hypothetical protein